MLRKQYQGQASAQRSAMYGQLVGAASSMAPGVYGALVPQGAGSYSYGAGGQSFSPGSFGTSYNEAAEQTMGNWAGANGW